MANDSFKAKAVVTACADTRLVAEHLRMLVATAMGIEVTQVMILTDLAPDQKLSGYDGAHGVTEQARGTAIDNLLFLMGEMPLERIYLTGHVDCLKFPGSFEEHVAASEHAAGFLADRFLKGRGIELHAAVLDYNEPNEPNPVSDMLWSFYGGHIPLEERRRWFLAHDVVVPC